MFTVQTMITSTIVELTALGLNKHKHANYYLYSGLGLNIKYQSKLLKRTILEITSVTTLEKTT